MRSISNTCAGIFWRSTRRIHPDYFSTEADDVRSAFDADRGADQLGL